MTQPEKKNETHWLFGHMDSFVQTNHHYFKDTEFSLFTFMPLILGGRLISMRTIYIESSSGQVSKKGKKRCADKKSSLEGYLLNYTI